MDVVDGMALSLKKNRFSISALEYAIPVIFLKIKKYF